MGEKESRSCDAYFLFFIIHIIFVMVVILIVVLLVGPFLLIQDIHFLIPAGQLVLLYQCTHYSCSGGASGNSIFCGSYLCDLNDTDYHTRWHIGAALSFKPFYTHYALRGGTSDYSDFCGAFYINSRNDPSGAVWAFGAALYCKVL